MANPRPAKKKPDMFGMPPPMFYPPPPGMGLPPISYMMMPPPQGVKATPMPPGMMRMIPPFPGSGGPSDQSEQIPNAEPSTGAAEN